MAVFWGARGSGDRPVEPLELLAGVGSGVGDGVRGAPLLVVPGVAGYAPDTLLGVALMAFPVWEDIDNG